MRAYYNEIDGFAAQWLRNLIANDHIASGVVDERSIVDLNADELRSFRQCHFFAGIGGWSYALDLADWPADREVWTGSCPCQPLSSAGQHKGHVDERHLWLAFYRLIAECRPPTIFGEQVASKDGREWLAGIRADLEGLGYAVGATDLPAACVGSPQKRQRLFWVAHSKRPRLDGQHQAIVRQCSSSRTSNDPWSNGSSIIGIDGARRIKPDVGLLAHGIPNRVGRLRGYGNAIVPQVAATFVKAFLDIAA